jgi:predicted nucleic acid-binding protein
MKTKFFVDTNLLLYGYDQDAKEKHEMAVTWLKQLWETKTGIISTQVLQEFYVNATRKISSPISPERAREILTDYLIWQVEINTPNTILVASNLQERHCLSFWDAMIVAAARQGGANILLTEDLNHGQVIEGIRIQNPFLNSE